MDSNSEQRADEPMPDATWLHRLAHQLIHDTHDAEDLVQDTWVAALRSQPKIVDPRERRSWLARVARNLVARRLRDSAVREGHVRLWAKEAERRGEVRTPTSGDLSERLESLVAEVREPYRSSLLLRFQAGLAYDQIARQQNVSVAAARQRVSRALAMLRRRLEGWNEARLRAWEGTPASDLVPLREPTQPGSSAWPLSVALSLLLGAAIGWLARPDSPKPPSPMGSAGTAEERMRFFEPYVGFWAPAESRSPSEAIDLRWELWCRALQVREYESFPVEGSSEPGWRLRSTGSIGWHPESAQYRFHQFTDRGTAFSGRYWIDPAGVLWREYRVHDTDGTSRDYRERYVLEGSQACTRSIEYRDDDGAWRHWVDLTLERRRVRPASENTGLTASSVTDVPGED